jgi:hypothetical protein
LWLHRFDWRAAAGGVCGGAAFFGWFRYVVFRRAFADAANRSHHGRVT